jgi:hypothetical protein
MEYQNDSSFDINQNPFKNILIPTALARPTINSEYAVATTGCTLKIDILKTGTVSILPPPPISP